MRHIRELRARKTRAPSRKLEQQVEAGIGELLGTCGFREIRFSQARATQQTPGIPDRRYVHRELGLGFWFEVKAPGGRQSRPQREFELDCLAVGELYVLGGKDTARVLITALRCYDEATGLTRPQGWRARYPDGLGHGTREELIRRIRSALDAAGVEAQYRYEEKS